VFFSHKGCIFLFCGYFNFSLINFFNFKRNSGSVSYHTDHFPILGIQEFSENQLKGCNLLFNELYGARSIDDPHKHDFLSLIFLSTG
jgi:hypothetical protein